MRFLAALFALFALASFRPAENVPAEVTQLSHQFIQATLAKDEEVILGLLDSTYRTQQFEGLFEGNSELFFKQFYAGYRSGGEGFATIPLKQIKTITLAGAYEEKGVWKLSFAVGSKKETVQFELSAVVRTSGGKTIWGLVGAWG